MGKQLHIQLSDRPIGVILIAALLAVIAIIGLIGSLPALLFSQGLAVAFNAVAVGICGILLFNAWGLWTLQAWALPMVRIVIAFNLFLVLLNFVYGAFGIPTIFEAMLFGGLLAYVLLDEKFEQAFRQETTET
ncbi:MAG: hypothetical protein ACOCYT_04805 [Chloroflexota bacterium]